MAVPSSGGINNKITSQIGCVYSHLRQKWKNPLHGVLALDKLHIIWCFALPHPGKSKSKAPISIYIFLIIWNVIVEWRLHFHGLFWILFPFLAFDNWLEKVWLFIPQTILCMWFSGNWGGLISVCCSCDKKKQNLVPSSWLKVLRKYNTCDISVLNICYFKEWQKEGSD